MKNCLSPADKSSSALQRCDLPLISSIRSTRNKMRTRKDLLPSFSESVSSIHFIIICVDTTKASVKIKFSFSLERKLHLLSFYRTRAKMHRMVDESKKIVCRREKFPCRTPNDNQNNKYFLPHFTILSREGFKGARNNFVYTEMSSALERNYFFGQLKYASKKKKKPFL